MLRHSVKRASLSDAFLKVRSARPTLSLACLSEPVPTSQLQAPAACSSLCSETPLFLPGKSRGDGKSG
jgi:hypothetical protein